MPRNSFKYLFAISLLMLFVAVGPLWTLEGKEYQIKGAMMINFIKFVQWPEPFDTDITIGIVGKNNFGSTLDQIEGRAIGGKQISIRRINSTSRIDDCQVLFISASELNRFYQILREVAGTPVLTIGEHEDFLRLGGIIRFYNEKDHIRFEINQSAAQKSNLKLSAKLLEVATGIQ